MPKLKPKVWDFEGWATRYGIKCGDGETIAHGAFSGMDGETVSLVDDHARGYEKYLDSVIGNAYLEHRDEGVYAYITFNPKYSKAVQRKDQVEHGDIQKLSIKANQLRRNQRREIIGGIIRDLSIVAAGANPGAFIQQVELVHGDGFRETLEDEAYIGFGDDVTIMHAESESSVAEKKDSAKEATVAEVYEGMTDDQKAVTLFIAASMLDTNDDAEEDDESVEQSDDTSEEDLTEDDDSQIEHSIKNGGNIMKANEFSNGTITGSDKETPKVTVADFMDTLRHTNSFSKTCIEHGVDNIADLYDDPKAVNPEPLIVNTPQGWVKSVLGGVKKVPFNRIKSLWTDLSAFEGDHRAKGYPVLGEKKLEEQISVLNRTTDPGWIYKLQKIDRDVLYQITSFNFLQWLQQEMGMMLNQELARAILITDGRTASDQSKIKEDRVRPIAYDDDVWTIKETVSVTATADDVLDSLIQLRSDYMGSGLPSLFVDPKTVGKWLTAKDSLGRRLYKDVSEITGLIRVSEIVEVPQLAVAKTAVGDNINAIMVNMADYALSMPTGNAALKDTKFDIDYNRESYLLEWLVGGSLITPKSAIVLSQPEPEE